MSPDDFFDDPPHEASPFACSWTQEGPHAASVRASGTLGVADVPTLDRALGEALRHGRLVVVNLHGVPSIAPAALRVMIVAAVRARETGKRLLVVAPAHTGPLLAAASASGDLEVLQTGGAVEPGSVPSSGAAPDRRMRPLENPVNVRVLVARIKALPTTGLWLRDSDGVLHRAWAPPEAPVLGLSEKPLEIYLDRHGELNGWRDPDSGLAINQRGLALAQRPPGESAVVCEGPCGTVWRAPAAAALIEHDERCLTCAGPLVLD